ncbi:hypothetical protein HY498_02840 [Candidatus Woesearchaeota archaeon]|nr:hypothetical protein [Candidatus Woesearchaeota archaeon]
MSDKVKGLNVRELLKNTYSRLSERHNPQEIVIPNRALAEIANDSDWHRTRVGYMGYESAEYRLNKDMPREKFLAIAGLQELIEKYLK